MEDYEFLVPKGVTVSEFRDLMAEEHDHPPDQVRLGMNKNYFAAEIGFIGLADVGITSVIDVELLSQPAEDTKAHETQLKNPPGKRSAAGNSDSLLEKAESPGKQPSSGMTASGWAAIKPPKWGRDEARTHALRVSRF